MENTGRSEGRIYSLTTLLMVVLFILPAIGFIASCVMSFTLKNKNARAVARAFLILHLIFTIAIGFLTYKGYQEVYKPYKEGGWAAVIPSIRGTKLEEIAVEALGLTEEQIVALNGLSSEQIDAAITGDFSKIAGQAVEEAAKAYGQIHKVTMTVGMPSAAPNIFQGKPVETVKPNELFHVYGTKVADYERACSDLRNLGYFDMGKGTENSEDTKVNWHYFVSPDGNTQITLSKEQTGELTAVEVKDITGTYLTKIGSGLPTDLDGHLMTEVTEGMGASKTTTYTVYNVTKAEADAYLAKMGEVCYATFTEDAHGEFHISGKDYCSVRYYSDSSTLVAMLYTGTQNQSEPAEQG